MKKTKRVKLIKFMIQDWAGNIMDHKGVFQRPYLSVYPMEFKSFEEGWDWIYTNVNDEEAYQDLFVEELV